MWTTSPKSNHPLCHHGLKGATISILQAQLNDIDTYAAGVTGDVEKITEFFMDNLDQLNASGATLDNEVDTLIKG